MFLKAVAVWLLIAFAETLHGILRVKLLNPSVGDRRARQLAVISGSAIILLIGSFTVPWIAPTSHRQSLAIGALWLVLMLGFDLLMGRLLMRASWSRIFADFDPRQGGFLAFGMAALFITPWLISRCLHLY